MFSEKKNQIKTHKKKWGDYDNDDSDENYKQIPNLENMNLNLKKNQLIEEQEKESKDSKSGGK